MMRFYLVATLSFQSAKRPLVLQYCILLLQARFPNDVTVFMLSLANIEPTKVCFKK